MNENPKKTVTDESINNSFDDRVQTIQDNER